MFLSTPALFFSRARVRNKTKAALEASDRVQLFVYLLLVAHHEQLPFRMLTGVLCNCRTKERETVRVRDVADAERLLSLVLDVHLDRTRSVRELLGEVFPAHAGDA